MKINSGLLAPSAAALGVAAFAVVFALELGNFRRAVLAWAERDLGFRTAVAAEHLAEPLALGDFAKLHRFGTECEAKGLRLTVFGAGGAHLYDSRRANEPDASSLVCENDTGEFRLRLELPFKTVLAPYRRAQRGFLLAALLGGAGVLAVFFFSYRQRLRLREFKRLEKFRRDFIADLSHEIKTPLTGILGATDFLADLHGRPDDPARPLLEMLRRESVRLDALVKDILSLSRLERGTDAARFEPHDLADLLRTTAERFAPRAAKEGVELSVRLPDRPAVCVFDARLVESAVSNLLLNAFVHARPKRIDLSLDCSDREVRISVGDDGTGIGEADAKRVFERFYRADPSRANATGGSGLGLAIVRGIARLHGGDASLERLSPRGTRFTIAFPGSASAAPTAP